MELIPAIANYFGVSIDELFGDQVTRDARVEALIARVDALHSQNTGVDKNLDVCIRLLRDGLAEFRATRELPFVWHSSFRIPAGFAMARRSWQMRKATLCTM
jgi:hypothetical protein